MLKGSPVPQRIGWPVPLEERIRDNSWFLGWKESLKQPTGGLTGLSSETSCFIFPSLPFSQKTWDTSRGVQSVLPSVIEWIIPFPFCKGKERRLNYQLPLCLIKHLPLYLNMLLYPAYVLHALLFCVLVSAQERRS